MILRTITVMTVMCLCYLIPLQVLANASDYAPEMDPIISEESEKISLTCPPPITIDCDEDGIYLSYAEFEANGGSVNIPDGCEVDSFTFVVDVQVSQNGCSFVYMREYFITETCGNTFTCNQIVQLVDDDDPIIINCPSDTTLAVTGDPCTLSFTIPEIETSDGCSDVTVTDNAPTDFGIGTTTVTYTATDECGNSSQCSFDVIVVNNSPLTVECSPAISDSTVCDASEIPAYADFDAFITAGGSATRDCDSAGTTFIIDSFNDIQTGGSCPKTVNRTYVISDGNGNVDSCTQVIITVDTIRPTFTVPPDVMDIDCALAQDTSVTGSPTDVMDNCDPNPSVTFMDFDLGTGACIGETTFSRMWMVTDTCGNIASEVQLIGIVDNTPPTAICQDTVVVYLDSNGDVDVVAEDLDNGSFDACSVVTFEADMSDASCNQTNIFTIVKLIVSDDCDNKDSCDVVLVVIDSLDVVLNSPTNDTVSCLADLDPVFPNISDFEDGGGSVDDNCPVGHTFVMIEADTSGVCPIIVTRIYEYIDVSDNSDTALHTIYIIDTVPPSITCPMNISISETDLCDTLLVFGPPTVTENCGDYTMTNNYTNDTSNVATFSGGVTEIMFTVIDACGNQDSCTMMVTVDADPVISCPPLGEINSEADLPNYPSLVSFLMAGGSVNMFCAIDDTTFMYTNSFVIEDDGCTATITETITINDTLGNPFVETKMNTIMDTLNPVITNCFDQFVPLIHETCEIDTTFFFPSMSDITDNFGIDTTYFTVGAFVDDTAAVVYYAEDFCGNIDSCEFELILYDPTSPDIGIDDITIMCDTTDAAPIYTTVQEFLTGQGAMVYDCRLDSSSFTHINDTIINGIINRTYSIEDSSDQSATVLQLITIIDSTDPEITMCTADIAMNAETDTCGITITVPIPLFMDNCNGTIILTNDYTGTDDASGFYPVGMTTVIWTITDGNSLTDTCSFTVTITDVTDPEVNCPPDTTIMCSIDNYPALASIPDFISGGGEASDNCELMSISSSIDSTGNTYTRTYTVFDVNGLQDTCTQTIEVIDTIAPVLDCENTIIVNTDSLTCDMFVDIEEPTVTDNCDADPVVTNSLTGDSDPSGVYSDTTSITWYAEDDFGNVDSCTYMIIVVDGTGPLVADANDTLIMCVEMLADIDIFMTVQDIVDAGGNASDNCGIEFINLADTLMLGDTIRRIYEVIDSTGNTSTLIQNIIIDDTTPPTFDAPADITIECDDDANDLTITGTVDSTLFADNCMDIDTLIYIDIVDAGVCPFVAEISRIWILTDDSGNETRDTQQISTIDTIAPDFDNMPDDLDDIDCDGVFPTLQDDITATDDCTGATVLMDILPFMENICSGYDVSYRWIAVDGCGNGDTILRTFSVNPDLSPPSLVNINDVTVYSPGDICGIRVDSVPAPMFDEDCSDFDVTRNYTDSIYHVGVNNVSWTATNDCGLDTMVSQTVLVIDTILPVAICKSATAGITADPQNYVYASSFINSATDNCGVDSIFVRRTTAACGDMSNNVFGDSIHICCEDIGLIIDIDIRIVDESGNENFCNTTLEVEDNLDPLVLSPLPNIVISCSYVFDTSDLDVFGSFTTDPAGREDIVIEDILYESQDSIAGIDGLISDECMVTIIDTTIVNLDNCSNGSIQRIFTFTDVSGNITMSSQLIVIQDVSPFTESDILWPENFTWDECGAPAPDTTISGAPVFLNLDKCAQVAASFKDQLFNFPTTICPKVRRKWKVIDWCQYDEDLTPNPGLWTYNQYIFVVNTVPPTILSACTDTLICAPNNECSAIVSLSIEAEDDCEADSQYLQYEYTININSDSNSGNDISGEGNSFSHNVESGIHEVTWTVTDRCGNPTTCSYILTVKECKAPTAVCLTGLVIGIDDAGQAELWASDVNQSSNDNCTENDNLIFSFSADVTDLVKIFDCDDVEIPQNIEMWVTDMDGNQSFCSTFVDVQDNNGYCNNINGNDDPNSLQGKIATETNNAILEAMVSIYGAEMDEEYMTTDDGEYAFEGLNVENDYQIAVERDKDDSEGVSTLDLVLIQRHILGLEQLNSPYKLIAADVNNNEKVSASDLVALRKLILGIDASFPDNESWRFVSMDAEMDDMSNPWPFSEDLIIGNEPLQNIEAGFIGVKIGDVNNTIDNIIGENTIESRNDRSFGIVTKDQRVHRDNEVLVDFISGSNKNLEALQMTIEWDTESMNFVDIIPIGIQIEEAFVNKSLINEGKISIAWNSVESKSIQEGMPIFQLIFEGNRSFNLSENLTISSEITKALAYDEHDVEHDVELRFVEGETEGFMLFQNKPNPFASETVVEFALPEDMEVTFKVFNGAGSLIYTNTRLYNEGINAFKLSEELKDHKGLLFLKMETAEFSEVKRMIRID